MISSSDNPRLHQNPSFCGLLTSSVKGRLKMNPVFQKSKLNSGLTVVMQREGEAEQLRWVCSLRLDRAQPLLSSHQRPQRRDSALTHIFTGFFYTLKKFFFSFFNFLAIPWHAELSKLRSDLWPLWWKHGNPTTGPSGRSSHFVVSSTNWAKEELPYKGMNEDSRVNRNKYCFSP